MKAIATPECTLVTGDEEISRFITSLESSNAVFDNSLSSSESLKFSLNLLLHSGIPMILFWGRESLCFYNDAFLHLKDHHNLPQMAESSKEILDETWNQIKPLLDQVISNGNPIQKEDLLISESQNSKGEIVAWSFAFSPIKTTNSTVEGVLVIGNKRVSSTNLKSTPLEDKEDLQFALDAGELGAWNLNPSTNVFTCNQKTREIFGLPPEEKIDLNLALDRVVPSDKQRVQAAIAGVFQPGSPSYDIEYSLINPHTGEEKIVRARGKTYFAKDGSPLRLSGTLQDITSERKYRKELEKFKQLIDNTADFMAMASLDGQMKFMNKQGRKLVGLSQTDDITNYRIKGFYSEKQFESIQSTIIPIMYAQGYYSGEVFIRHIETGEEIPCYGNYILIPDPITKEPISRALTLRDLRPELAASKELRESESRFRNLVEVATVATAVYIGEEMSIQWANDAMIKLWGKDKSVIGKTVREALPELEGQPFHEQLQQVYATGETYEGKEDRGDLVVDGKLQTFYFNFSYKALRDANGNVYGILNMAMDVTEQVLARRYLQESERNFINLIMQAPVGICIIRAADLLIELANDNYLSLVGKKKEQIINKRLLEALPELKGHGYDDLLKQVIMTGKAYHGYEQQVLLYRNGKEEIVYVNFVYQPLLTNNIATQILVTAYDVTPQVEAKHKLEELEERARLAIDAASLGTFEHNYITNQIIVSERSFELYETRNNNTVPDFIINVHPDDLVIRQEAYQRMKKTGVLEYEVRIVKPDKTTRWVSAKGRLYKNEEGKELKLLGIVQDVTEQKALEEELERRVQQRTNELVTINNELQQFAYLASHDLQEPLRKIQIFAGLLPRELPALNEKGRDYLQKISASSNRMATLISNLLEFSQLSNTSTKFVATDLNPILQNIKEDFELSIKDKNAIIITEPLPTLEAIPLQMNQLFYNLISNALKFSKDCEPPHITIEVERLPKEQVLDNPNLSPHLNYYRLRFIDRGIGFRQEAAEKIFTIFQRLHARDVYSGTGIGLALCKKIALNHKGDIYAFSEEGKGSVFHVLLPETQQ